VIATVAGTGEVVFNPPAIVGDANNLGTSLNNAFPVNSSFDFRYADLGKQGGGAQEIDIIGLEQVALQNNTVNNGDGLVSVPFQVAAGATGSFNVAFNVSTNYTGFAKTIAINNTQFLTNPASFPHVGTTIEVRASRRGDMNGDSFADSEDIPGFIAALTSITTFEGNFPWLQARYVSDFNQDTFVDSEDIPGLVAAFGGAPSPATVPEPSTVVLAVLGVAGLLAARRRFPRL
jgi:hypothetical protein